MTIEITITTGGLTKIGKRRTYHIYKESDFGRVAKKIKEIVKEHPAKVDLYGIGQSVEGMARSGEFEGVSEAPLQSEDDVNNWMHDLKMYHKEYLKKEKKLVKV